MAPRKPAIGRLSPRDRVATISHLADTIDHNSKHAYSHAKSVAAIARKVTDPAAETLRFNAEHSAKHSREVAQHAKKLLAHLKKYPGAAAAYNELANARPSIDAAPPTRK